MFKWKRKSLKEISEKGTKDKAWEAIFHITASL